MSTAATPAAVFQEDVNEEVNLVVQDKLAKANITEQHLSELRKELGPLADKAITNKEEAALVQGGLTKLIRTRGIITKICEAGRKPAIQLQRAWIATEKELNGVVLEIEKPLQARKDAWVAEQNRIEAEELERQQQAIQARLLALEKLGFVRRSAEGLMEDRYVLGETALPILDITTADDERWANLLRGAEMAAKEEQDRKDQAEAEQREKERLAKEEADRVKAAAEETARKERELAAKEERLNEQTRKYRVDALKARHMVEDGGMLTLGTLSVVVATLHTLGDPEFDRLCHDAEDEKRAVDQLAKEEAEAAAAKAELAAQAKLRTDRRTELLANGFVEICVGNDDRLQTHDQLRQPWSVSLSTLHEHSEEKYQNILDLGKKAVQREADAREQKIRDEAAQQERDRIAKQEADRKEADAERIRQGGDVARIEVMIRHLEDMPWSHDIESAIGKQGVVLATAKINDALANLRGTLKDIQA